MDKPTPRSIEDGIIASSSGQRAVAIGGAVSQSVIVTGDVYTFILSLGVPTSLNQSSDTDQQASSGAETSGARDLNPSEIGHLVDLISKLKTSLPAETALIPAVSVVPPPLPKPHVSREEAFAPLLRKLKLNPVVAVVGYPKSGKTTALAEFAGVYHETSIWLTVPDSATSSDEWLDLATYHISQFLGSATTERRALQSTLVSHAANRSVVIVFDDAHLIRSLGSLEFLKQATAAANGRLQVILAGIDRPDFLENLRISGQVTWRLPGFTVKQAESLYRKTAGPLSTLQKKALAVTLAHTHGHPGMLRLAHEDIRSIQSRSDFRQFCQAFSGGMGAGLESFQAGLVQRFRAGLSADEVELCRRVSVAFRPFPKRLANAMWCIERNAADFPAAWNGCVLRAFEDQPLGRFVLPELYRQGLLACSSPSEQAGWHAAAAEELSKPVNNMLGVLEVHDAIAHRIHAGDYSRVVHDAAMFLAVMKGPDTRMARQFLIRHFERWLSNLESHWTVSVSARIRWHAIRADVYRYLGESQKAQAATDVLLELLRNCPQQADENAVVLGWAVLLVQAGETGNVDLAIQAAQRVTNAAVFDGKDTYGSHHSVVLMAFLNAARNPLDYLEAVFESDVPTRQRLWQSEAAFDLWRMVGFALYIGIERECGGDKIAIAHECESILALSKAANQRGELEIAAMLAAFASRAQIDFLRDFAAATATARMVIAGPIYSDKRLTAFSHHSLGNALRCASDAEHAESAYRQALSFWPADQLWERAETHFMFGICAARQGRVIEAARSFRASAHLYQGEKSRFSDQCAAASYLEGAAAWMIAGSPKRALRSLICAHALLKCDRRTAEWVAVAQLAQRLANRAERGDLGSTIPEAGFTIGFRSLSQEAEGMEPYAPTLMIAMACTTWDAPNRALSYLDDLWNQDSAPEMRYRIAFLGMDTAVTLRRHVAATRYGLVLAEQTPNSDSGDPLIVPANIIENQLVRVVGLFVNYQPDVDALADLSAAAALVRSHTGPETTAVSVYKAAISCVVEAIVMGEATGLERAYETAAVAKAKSTARHLSWYWLFGSSVGKQVQPNDLILWQWRLCWLSAHLADADPDFGQRFIEQQLWFWTNIESGGQCEFAQEILNILQCQDGGPSRTMGKLREYFEGRALKECGVGKWIREVGLQIRAADDLTTLAGLREKAVAALGNLLVSPVAGEYLNQIRADVEVLKDSVSSRGATTDENARLWAEDVHHLEMVIAFITAREPIPGASEALFRLAPLASQFMVSSAAHFYVLLRHSISSKTDRNLIDQIQKSLCSQHAAAIAAANGLPSGLRVGLLIARLSAKGFIATGCLANAATNLSIQQKLRGPIPVLAVLEANTAFAATMREINECVAALDRLEAECKGKKELQRELALVYLERGLLRKLVAAILKGGLDGDAVGDQWLRPGALDFAAAIEAAEPQRGLEMELLQLRVAFEGRSIAEVLLDQNLLIRFNDVIESYRSSGRHADEIRSLEASRDTDVLHLSASNRQGTSQSWLQNADEDTIKQFADVVMKAAGYPEDRRRNVEDDIRKTALTDRAQRQFCRYLEPLQNLLHHSLPETVFASPTRYVCSCALLGYQTGIELNDIEVVIDVMKRTYCEGCDKRSPLAGHE